MRVRKTKSNAERRARRLRNPIHAAAYLNAALEGAEEENNDRLLLRAFRNIAEAHQMSSVADKTGLNRESLYRMLSESGNPTWQSLRSILTALGITMSFIPAACVGEHSDDTPEATEQENRPKIFSETPPYDPNRRRNTLGEPRMETGADILPQLQSGFTRSTKERSGKIQPNEQFAHLVGCP